MVLKFVTFLIQGSRLNKEKTEGRIRKKALYIQHFLNKN